MTASRPPARTLAQGWRTRRRLDEDIDAWVATAAGDTPYLAPLSFLWDGETFLVATSESGRTGRNLAATGKVRLGLGLVRDVVLVEGTVEAVLAPEDIPGTWASASWPRPASTPGPRAPPSATSGSVPAASRPGARPTSSTAAT